MRIAATIPLYPPHSLVGAWITTHEFLAHAARVGHDVTVHTSRYHGADYDLDGVHVRSGRRGRSAQYTALGEADIVVCHGPEPWVSALDVPVVRMVHSAYDLAPFWQDTLVVFNSTSLAADIPHDDVRSIVLHPPVDPARYRTTPGDAVTIVGRSVPKGIRTAWRCAERLPHRQFIGVRGGYGEQLTPRAKNFAAVDQARDMRAVYARTRILLMPSSVETWGRTGVEAMASGIPVIAHPTPGLVESLGPAGIFVDRDDIAGWVDAIERLHDPDEYAAASARAVARSAELDPAADLATFVASLEAIHAERTTHP